MLVAVVDHATKPRGATGLTSVWGRGQPRLLALNLGQFPFKHGHLCRNQQNVKFIRIIPALNVYR